MGRNLHPLLALLASVTLQELTRQVAYLKEENRILRVRLPLRFVVREREKRRLHRCGHRMGLQLMVLIWIVSYHSFCHWLREAGSDRTVERTATVERNPGL